MLDIRYSWVIVNFFSSLDKMYVLPITNFKLTLETFPQRCKKRTTDRQKRESEIYRHDEAQRIIVKSMLYSVFRSSIIWTFVSPGNNIIGTKLFPRNNYVINEVKWFFKFESTRQQTLLWINHFTPTCCCQKGTYSYVLFCYGTEWSFQW